MRNEARASQASVLESQTSPSKPSSDRIIFVVRRRLTFEQRQRLLTRFHQSQLTYFRSFAES